MGIEINWAKSHCGLYRAPLSEATNLMPELAPVLETWPGYKHEDWTIDVKVHMLKPKQWPCIPNWHYDNVPRDRNNVQDFTKRVPGALMWLWLSGAPLTEFKANEDPYTFHTFHVEPERWHSFTQWDEHRGTVSEGHVWRCFIRLSPYTILKPAPRSQWLRRHSQVYLDAGSYKW